ncbi:membrane-anchored ubiquitin-fold protein 4-like isoform X2 [Zingiber officinale]|uniref:membrane-anchored ubiquitin-fold protein 4-like isoform X2 n=1 Tax=Zingiber officinale TaxID=94328 RepID=UPI001C4C7070|nr:membrane-anchored ubiquitin-fold protein 4-like isoform X2 [Zingiber officinale]
MAARHGTLCNYLELLAIIAFLVPLVKLLRDWGTFEANVQFWDNKKIVPKVANDVKLISAGKVLENNKTIAQCRSPFGEIPAGIITMHVVVQQSSSKIKTEKKIEESPKKTFCSCSIL